MRTLLWHGPGGRLIPCTLYSTKEIVKLMAKRNDAADDAQIAEFLAKRGATKCPPGPKPDGLSVAKIIGNIIAHGSRVTPARRGRRKDTARLVHASDKNAISYVTHKEKSDVPDQR